MMKRVRPLQDNQCQSFEQGADLQEQETEYPGQDMQNAMPLPLPPVPVAYEPPIPQAQPIEQSIHTIIERQRMNRRKWLRRFGAVGLSLFAAASGSLSGLLYTQDRRQQQQLTTQAQQTRQQIDAASKQSEKQGYQLGYHQAVIDIVTHLGKLNDVTPGDALTSASNLLALYTVFVQPIANNGTSIDTMLSNARACRAVAVEFGSNADGLTVLINILEYWQNNEGNLPSSLDVLSKSNLQALPAYLNALQQFIATLGKSR